LTVILSVTPRRAEEHSLCEKLDAYLLGEVWLSVGWGYVTRLAVSRTELQEHLVRFRESRFAPFLERAGLTGDLSTVPDEQFRERVLRLRCYLAEPDDPSDELLARLRVVASLSNLLSSVLGQLISVLGQRINLLELKRALRPLQKSLASVAPELHPLCYSIAEHLARIGEHSPEDPDLLHQETELLCHEWLNRLHAYWHATLG
jgi:hypothetical protein